MKVTVVGFWGGYPHRNEATSSYLVEHEGFKLLVDCGSGALAQLQNYIEPEDVDAMIISHYHHDHIADVGVFQYARLIQKHLGKALEVLPIYGHSHDKHGFERLTHSGITQGFAYDPNETLQIGPFSISFLQTKHPVTCYAMRIQAGNETIVYTADSSYIEEFVPFSRDADFMICECNFYGNQDGSGAGHMTSVDAGKLAAQSNVKHLLLTHLPHYGNHQQLLTEARQHFQGEITIAKSGWTCGQ
ncbi:MBL fold metallo-hydrolase [Metabacillus iocasae]|uniref:Ribonuclease BN (tRNA processing enzyme) n=1 Tax=Priestia iocasae TaxID=2291674 RepID=A0ABS2QT62_9BACI|nr:MBL fold metallo-hydrolase [Metabacillus iocasae]MBM7702658.1 ribonuclease BN (tRNA processing enzyme) [Metabacillus iocasae]